MRHPSDVERPEQQRPIGIDEQSGFIVQVDDIRRVTSAG